MGQGGSAEKFVFDKNVVVGRGNSGFVYKGSLADGTAVAVKVVPKSISAHHKGKVEAECEALKLDHPNILRLLAMREDKDNYYLAMNYCAGGNLEDFIRDRGPLPEAVARNSVGTMHYCAPEVLTAPSYDNKVDVWSIAITLYFMLTGKLPFNTSSMYKYLQSILSGKFAVPENRADISDELWGLLEKMLKVNPAERIDIHQLARVLGVIPGEKTDKDAAEKMATDTAENTLELTAESHSLGSNPRHLHGRKASFPSSAVRGATWLLQELAVIADVLASSDSTKLEALSLYICTATLCRQQLDTGDYPVCSVVRRILLHVLNCCLVKTPSLLAGVPEHTPLPSPAAALRGFLAKCAADPQWRLRSDKKTQQKHTVLQQALAAGRLG
eukprot:gene34853-42205_t